MVSDHAESLAEGLKLAVKVQVESIREVTMETNSSDFKKILATRREFIEKERIPLEPPL